MRCSRVVLEAVGVWLPQERVSTAQIESSLAQTFARWSIPKGQIESMTGIVERRFWPEPVSLAQMGAYAVQDALTRCHVPIDAIGALVYASVCREANEPATACMVAQQLCKQGVELSAQAELFDLSNACLGALNAMLVMARRIELQEIRAGVVVVCESAREIVATAIGQLRAANKGENQAAAGLSQFASHLATLTGGSGAAALILSDGSFSPYGEQTRVLGGVCRSDVSQVDLCRWGFSRQAPKEPNTPFGGPYILREQMVTNSVALLTHGVQLGQETFEAFLDEMRWHRDELALTVGHQVGRAHQHKILAALGLCPSRDHVTYTTLGNTGSAAVPLTLADAEQCGRLERGDKVALLGIGSGLNCMMIGLQW